MALDAFQHIRNWIFLLLTSFLPCCWYFISDYWFWWIHRFTAVWSYGIIRFFAKTFQVLEKQHEDRCNRLGKVYVTYENHKPVINVADPDLIKEMLVPTNNTFPGAKIQKLNLVIGHNVTDKMVPQLTEGSWESVRRNISLAFTPGKFRRSAHVMEHCCQKLCHFLILDSKWNEFIDLKKVFDDFCVDMIFCTMFGADIKSSEDSEKASIMKALRLLRTNVSKNSSFSQKDAQRKNQQSLIGTTFMSEKDLLKFQELIDQIIRKRKANKQAKTDFLQLLMEAFSLDKKVYEPREDRKSPGEDSFTAFFGNKDMSLSDLIAQCLLFFTEGYQVTSSALCLVIYNLALNPSHQERLRKEIKETLLTEKQISFDSVNRMTYLDQVVCETFRLYPPVTRLQRFAAHDYALEEPELIIPKGSTISIPLCIIHRNAEHYPNPKKFDPQRFAAKQWSKRHPYAFIPFGVGARNCIGMKFALMEIKLCLVHLLKHVRFLKTTKTKIPLEFHQNQILLEPKEMHLRVEEVQV